jgi:hypothetical protein
MENEGGNLETARLYIQKGLDISNESKNFPVPKTMLEPRSNFQCLLAKNIMSKLTLNKGRMTQDQLTQ